MKTRLIVLITTVLVFVGVVMSKDIIHRISSLGEINYAEPATVEQCDEGIRDLKAAIKDLQKSRDSLEFAEDKKTLISIYDLLKARQEIYGGLYRRRSSSEQPSSGENLIFITSGGDSVCVQNLLKIINKALELQDGG